MAQKPSAVSPDKPIEKVRFGNFEIINDAEGRPLALGKGTFGRTYQARHCYLETIVALKIITERYVSDPTVRQRFLIEARAVAKLSHPHIARLYDFGEADGVLHYAMEYCAGGSLADYVAKHGPLSSRQIVEVAQQITGALKCAHTAGFIHRDLKPSNIMLTGDESPLFTKLIDFGLVQPSLPGATRSVSDDQSADGARFLGTPLFASPEQLREEPMDVRTDLFSLGMTLWFLLVGGPPEPGSSAAIAASRLSPESYAGRLPASLPPQLKDILARLLEKDRNKRFASAAEAFSAINLCATILGFRRARDYTDRRADLAEVEEAPTELARPAQSLEPTPIEIEKINAPLSSAFTIAVRINEDFTGLNYVATNNTAPEQGVILHVLHPLVLQESSAMNRLRIHVAQLKALESPEVLRPTGIREFSDYTAIIVEKSGGNDLLSVLRSQRTVQLIHAAPLLESIADVCDALSTAGLPGVQLAPSRIFLQPAAESRSETGRGSINVLSNSRPQLYPRFLAVSEAPEVALLNEPEDITSTMTTDMLGDPSRADNMPEHFAALLYRIVAGRNCLAAASLSSQAYVPIPGLSEHSNQLLSLVIANQIGTTSCGQVFREILGAEGIVPRVAQHPSAGFTARGTGSTVSPVDVAPINRVAPLLTPTPTPPVDKVGTARSWQPPTVTPSPRTPPPIIPKAPVSTPPPTVETPPPQVATPPSPVIPQVVPTPTPPLVEARAKDSVPQPIAPPPPVIPEEVSTPAAEPVEARAKESPLLPDLLPAEEETAPPVISKETVTTPSPPVIPEEVSTPAAEPVEVRAKDSFVQRITTSPDVAPADKKEPKKSRLKRKFVTKPAISEGPTESVVPKPDAAPSAPAPEMAAASLPAVLPPPSITTPASRIGKWEKSRLPVRMPDISWRDPKVRAAGIGIAALLFVSLSFAVVRKVWRTARPSTPVVVAPTETQPQPSAAPVPHIMAGRYVGHLSRINRNRQTARSSDLERQISIDPDSATGYLIEYGNYLTTQIPLIDGQRDSQGVYTARAMFSSTTNGARNDETLTAKVSNDNNSLEVTFRPSSGEQYVWSGTFHPWGSDDQARYDALVAVAAQRQKEAEQARLEAEARAAEQQRQATAKAAMQQPRSEQPTQPSAPSTTSTRHRASSGGEGAKSAGASNTRQAASSQHVTTAAPPPPQPPPRVAPRPAPPKGETQKPQRAFEGGVPGQ